MQSSAVAATMLRLEQPSMDATCKQRRMLVLSTDFSGCTVKLCSGGCRRCPSQLTNKSKLHVPDFMSHACCRHGRHRKLHMQPLNVQKQRMVLAHMVSTMCRVQTLDVQVRAVT